MGRVAQCMHAVLTLCDRGGKGEEAVRERGCAECRSACLRDLRSARGDAVRGGGEGERMCRVSQCMPAGLTVCERGDEGEEAVRGARLSKVAQCMCAGLTDCERGGKGEEAVREGWRSACLRDLQTTRGEAR